MIKIFKNSNVIYFKDSEIFNDLIYKNENIFKGKIIISDFQELNRICYIKGIIHIINTSVNYVPDEKIDCIVNGNIKNSELEAYIVKHSLSIPVIYMDISKKQYQIWCGICNNIYVHNYDHIINKYCSDKCMKKDSGFIVDNNGDIKPDILKDLGLNNIVSKIIASDKDKDITVLEFDKSLSDKKNVSNVKKNNDKFQSSMVKDAIRLEYAFKRESYKKEMRQPSLRKTSLSNRKESKSSLEDISSIKLCKGITKKGVQCTNRAIGNSLYCGILSHSMLSDVRFKSESSE